MVFFYTSTRLAGEHSLAPPFLAAQLLPGFVVAGLVVAGLQTGAFGFTRHFAWDLHVPHDSGRNRLRGQGFTGRWSLVADHRSLTLSIRNFRRRP